MGITTLPQKLTASSLALLLVSCTATRPVTATRGPTGPHDLGRFVLVIQGTPDGRVTHNWKPLEDFDLQQYQHLLGTVGIGGSLKRTSTSMDDDQIDETCFEVWDQCTKRCNRSPLPPHAEHYIASYKNARAALNAYCADECRKESNDCRRRLTRQAVEPLEFRATGEAVDWLKRHKEELSVGGAVIITGVVFYVVMSSVGILILAPAFLLTSPDVPAEPHLAEAFQ
ncbi:hypothetical protein [Archangium lansingense]|uniref:Lipoprotein n=1 Tax=Archangium lansingense TaxID=2995310 RepID=A0ABT4A8V8_9BACT|nr:hypothetical protein [Archangium lansinium]MCY1077766.1 hypothetical protein [Archangium lansinium]